VVRASGPCPMMNVEFVVLEGGVESFSFFGRAACDGSRREEYLAALRMLVMMAVRFALDLEAGREVAGILRRVRWQ